MSDVERESTWKQFREMVLDVVWRDVYNRWYLISVNALWAFTAFVALPRFESWLVIPAAWLVQWLIGRACNTLEEWHEGEYTCDCLVCTEQRTGGAHD